MKNTKINKDIIFSKVTATNGFNNIKDSLIKKHFRRIISSTIDLYGKYIDWNKVCNMLNNTEIAVADEDIELAGSFNFEFKESQDIKQDNYFCRIYVNSEISLFEKICSLSHEFCHLCSVNLNKSNIDIDGNVTKMAGLSKEYYLFNENVKDSEKSYGESIDEGVTQFIANTIIYRCYSQTPLKSKIASLSYNCTSDSRYNWLSRRASLLYKIVENKLFQGYFLGEPKIIQKEFDKFVGINGWKTFINYLDGIFEIEDLLQEIDFDYNIEKKEKKQLINGQQRYIKELEIESDSIILKCVRNKLELYKNYNKDTSTSIIKRINNNARINNINSKLKLVEHNKINNSFNNFLNVKLLKDAMSEIKYYAATGINSVFERYLTK